MNPRHNIYALLTAFGVLTLILIITIIMLATTEGTVILLIERGG